MHCQHSGCAPPLQDKQRQLDAIETRRDALQQRKADLEAKIRELGPLPTEAFEAHHDRPLQELHKLLAKANQELKKFRWGSEWELAHGRAAGSSMSIHSGTANKICHDGHGVSLV